MRSILFLLTLAFATPAIAAPADLQEQKAEMKETRKLHKKLDRYARKWDRAVEKGKTNKIAKYDAKLGEIYQGELARLRALGVPTRVAEAPPPKPQHPAHPQKVLPELPAEPEHPKLERLRDDLVTLRDGQRERADGKGRVKTPERKALRDVQRSVEKRYERQDQRYEAAKERAKG